ncbi:PREDICTED: alpha-N-acetylgalactosaminidase-like [Priapulus caudatus]|uniref:Alpha-galactosidase n=1 Tax=Priapulus caudatus TaxID=37621 RepID=A0ABM1F0U0_PRICU|nr:PREDICTED: alpha-N-acetylgalactosaminidase-like [Priapulus caudatus]
MSIKNTLRESKREIKPGSRPLIHANMLNQQGKTDMALLLLVLSLFACKKVGSLNNGLALTPPMGWLAWERFRCEVDCDEDPYNCISESLFMDMADVLVSDGYKDAGYTYVNVDDCYMEKNRDSQGRLVADHNRFPSGMEKLGKYLHSKGLKYGMYESVGDKTCMNYPGSWQHISKDVRSFTSWKIDMFKFDGCFTEHWKLDKAYPEMGQALNKTGRPILYSCSWPYYFFAAGMPFNYTQLPHYCNMWRMYHDIDDTWNSISAIIKFYGDNQDLLASLAGPGHWNDPDMLIIGNYGLSYEQSKAQMAMWAVFAAPLFMSTDLRDIKPELRNILLNREVIAVNQDPLGTQGRKVLSRGGIEVWLRPIIPRGSSAVVFLNMRVDGTPVKFTTSLRDIGLTKRQGYHVREIFHEHDYGFMHPGDVFECRINPTGVVMITARLQSP